MDFLESLKISTNLRICRNEPMKNHTGYGVGGPAKYYVSVNSFNDLRTVVDFAKEFSLPLKIIGNGTNVLFSDKGFDGVIVSVKGLTGLFMKGERVFCACGVYLKKLVNFSVEQGYTGLEALSGVPATLGGAVVMNAGAFGHNISDYIVKVDVLKDGKLCTLNKDECGFRYRGSRLLDRKEIVLSAEFSLPVCDCKFECLERVREYSIKRKFNQPTGKTCGSVFKNPDGFSAGYLIEHSGLKGFSLGGASVSHKHCNFIVSSDDATANDVASLIKIIKEKVYKKYGIVLEEEIEYIGEF